MLIAGVAVPSLLLRLLPRWLGVTGIVLAALAEFSTLSLIWPSLAVLLPAARFPTLIWLLVVAWRLPHDRGRVPGSGGRNRAAEGSPHLAQEAR